MSLLEMGLVFEGGSVILKNRILGQEQCLSQGVGSVTPRRDTLAVVPSLQELLLLGTSEHICRANPGTSLPGEVQK